MDKSFEKVRKTRILFDMDDVLVDYLGDLLNRFNKSKGTSYKIKDITTWSIIDILGEEASNFLYEQDMYQNIKPKKHAIEVMRRLIQSEKFDIFIVSSCFPESYLDKINWIKKYMPFFPIKRFIPCSEKSAIWGDYLVDDCPANLIDFEKIGTPVILDMPTNRDCNEISNYKRVKNLIDFEKYLNESENLNKTTG